MTRAARLTTTRSGLQIGVAYVAPPPRMGAQAERIQQVLLHQPRAPGASDYLAAALALLVLRVNAAWQDSDLIALYMAHRRKGAGRWQSVRGALRCHSGGPYVAWAAICLPVLFWAAAYHFLTN
jgi:hypothetical protein